MRIMRRRSCSKGDEKKREEEEEEDEEKEEEEDEDEEDEEEEEVEVEEEERRRWRRQTYMHADRQTCIPVTSFPYGHSKIAATAHQQYR